MGHSPMYLKMMAHGKVCRGRFGICLDEHGPHAGPEKRPPEYPTAFWVFRDLRKKSALLLFLAGFLLLGLFGLLLRLFDGGELGFVELAVLVGIGGFELGLGLRRVLAASAEFFERERAVAVGIAVLVLLLFTLGLGGSGAKAEGEKEAEDGSCFHGMVECGGSGIASRC